MQKQTIALIDDDRNILTSLSIALEKEGFKVQTYIDGESALIGLTRTPPDLAVIDIKMPKMDGEELLKKLRKKTSLPVIFLTSKDDEIDELLGLKLGADDFVKKSGGFSIKVLIERIRVQLRKKDSKNILEENKSLISHGRLKLGRIIMLTGYGNIPTAVAAIKEGAIDYLAKPADAEDVEKALLADPSKKAAPPENPMSADRVKWEHIHRVVCQANHRRKERLETKHDFR